MQSRFDVKNGILVKEVKRFSIAAERNLRTGTVIIKADRQDIKTTGQLKNIIDKKEKGETILLNLRSREGNNFMVVLEVQ